MKLGCSDDFAQVSVSCSFKRINFYTQLGQGKSPSKQNDPRHARGAPIWFCIHIATNLKNGLPIEPWESPFERDRLVRLVRPSRLQTRRRRAVVASADGGALRGTERSWLDSSSLISIDAGRARGTERGVRRGRGRGKHSHNLRARRLGG